MASDITEKARRLLELDGKATPGPWHTGTQAWPGSDGLIACHAVYRSLDGGSDLIAPCNYEEPDADLIAETRTAAPDLARFALLVDEASSETTSRTGNYAEGWNAALMHLRRRCGLDGGR